MSRPAVIPDRHHRERGKHWCFTLNNYTEDDVEHLKSLGSAITYLLAGREVGASGTPHLQGFVSLSERMRLSQVKSLLGSSPHCELARDVIASAAYCKKAGCWFEVGEMQQGAGSRNDLVLFKATVKNGVYDFKVLRELHSQTLARYPEFCRQYVADNTEGPVVETHLLRTWQSQLVATLRGEPSKREIIFCVDLMGNTGKSWFCHYFESLNNNVQILVPGKKADMTYMVDPTARVVFLDCPRSKQGDFIQYDFLEELKNGYLFSPKYHSCVKKMKSPHVVVMMNEQPDMSKLSADRYDMFMITNDRYVPERHAPVVGEQNIFDMASPLVRRDIAPDLNAAVAGRVQEHPGHGRPGVFYYDLADDDTTDDDEVEV